MAVGTGNIIALDGHDGAGKTTLAKRLALELGGKYIKPFSGDAGKNLIEAAEEKDYERAIKIGKDAIYGSVADNGFDLQIYDRHWMTVLSLIPEKLWESWETKPPTVLCWIDLETTKTRLGERDEAKYSDDYHLHYLDAYASLAKKYDCLTVRTDQQSIESALKKIVFWFESKSNSNN